MFSVGRPCKPWSGEAWLPCCSASGAMEVTTGFSFALDLLRAIETGGVTLPEERALQLPKTVSDWDDSTIVMFLDEFQNTWLPEYECRVVGFMQVAVETNTCIHFVTGSALSMLADEILGKGALTAV